MLHTMVWWVLDKPSLRCFFYYYEYYLEAGSFFPFAIFAFDSQIWTFSLTFPLVFFSVVDCIVLVVQFYVSIVSMIEVGGGGVGVLKNYRR